MGANSKIEWCHHTFNPWIGCTKVHEGCAHCYAESHAKRTGQAVWGPGGTRVKTSEAYWRQPLKWNREAEAASERRRVFCASLADVFEDWQGAVLDHRGHRILECRNCADPDGRFESFTVPADDGRVYEHGCGERMFAITLNDLRRDLFALIDATPWLDWLLLTKRPENVRRMWPAYSYHACVTGDCPHDKQSDCDATDKLFRDNVWLGTSISNQETADRLVPELMKCRDLVPVLFLSAEPLLGPIRLIGCGACEQGESEFDWEPQIDWVIAGGESGPKARPCHVAWIRSLINQCKAAGVPCFVKQLGSFPTDMDEEEEFLRSNRETYMIASVRDSKGGDWNEWPEALRVREFPAAAAMSHG